MEPAKEPSHNRSNERTPSTGSSAKASATSAASGANRKRKKSGLGKIVTIIVLLLLAGGAYSLYLSSQEKNFGPGFAVGNGRLEATEIDIATKLAGRISEIRVDEGDAVTAGQILAVMQLDVLNAQLGEAKAQVFKAQANLLSAEAQVAVRESDVTAAEATVGQRVSELDQTRRRLSRSAVLSQRGVITGQEFDDDETSEMAAQAVVDSAKAQVSVAQAAVEAAKAEVKGAAASVRAAEATVASVLADIKDSHLTAPRNGRVQYRVSQPGEVLAAGGRVLNFVDLGDVYMNIFLPAEQAGRVRIGAEARIILDAYSEHPLPARVTYVAQTAQFTPKTVETESERQKLMFRVKAKVDREVVYNHEAYVKPGLPGVAWIRLDSSEAWPEELDIRPADRQAFRAAQAAASAAPVEDGAGNR